MSGGFSNMSKEDQERAMRLLDQSKRQAAKEKQKREDDPGYADRQKARERIKRAEEKLIIINAKTHKDYDLKIKPTDAQIQEEVAEMAKRSSARTV